jgi:hypothetical protein
MRERAGIKCLPPIESGVEIGPKREPANDTSKINLLRKTFPFVKRGELPEFDKQSGDFKHSIEISYFGRMLLREIGLATPLDAQENGAD